MYYLHRCIYNCTSLRLYVGRTSIPTDPIPDAPTPGPTRDNYFNRTDPCPECNSNCECQCTSGVLGVYRITLWIIVLAFTILSMAVTSSLL